MRIAVMTDVHANLPALEAALTSIGKEGCDAVFHTGDAIAIGPYPAECLELLLDTPNLQFVMGNHEAYFVKGVPVPRPAWMGEDEEEHQHWTHSCLSEQMRSVLAAWPYDIECEFEGVQATFVHYGLDSSKQDFAPPVDDAAASDLDKIFALHDSQLVFYGHTHRHSDLRGRARYVNPGSLGCYSQAIARYCMVDFRQGRYQVQHYSVPYDDGELFRAFEQRAVPARELIYRAFFAGRIHSR